MPLCKDCRFLYDGTYCVRDEIVAHEAAESKLDYVHGGVRLKPPLCFTIGRLAQSEREQMKRCQPSARWFEPKAT